MSAAQIILLVDGLVGLAMRLLDTAKPSDQGEADRLESLKTRLKETAEKLAAWRP